MSFEEAMRQPDADKFIKAMERELNEHHQLKHWKVISRRELPQNAKPNPMVWSMKRQRDPMGEIIKCKARLCAGGYCQIQGDAYWDTYAPVVSWSSVCLVFILALILGWEMRSIDFIMAYTQALVKTDIFITLPKGTTAQGVDPNKHILKLQQNLYGLKDGQLTWHEHIKKGLLGQGFQESKIDPCLFIKQQILLILYINDAALFSLSATVLDQEIKVLQ